MLATCFLLWCLGQSPHPVQQVTFTHDVRNAARTERIFAYERRWLVAGLVLQEDSRDAVFGGALPLNVTLLHGRLSMDGGVVVASNDVPGRGTQANFMARAQFHLTDRLAVTYWHGPTEISVTAIPASTRWAQAFVCGCTEPGRTVRPASNRACFRRCVPVSHQRFGRRRDARRRNAAAPVRISADCAESYTASVAGASHSIGATSGYRNRA
jgi:hypothetical protein